MKELTRDELLALTDVPKEALELPQVGIVYVRGMSGKERDQWENALMVGRGTNRRVDIRNARARLAVRCLVDAHGVRLFDDKDAERLGNIRADHLQRIFNVAQRLSGVSDEDLDELGKSSGNGDGAVSSST